MADRNLLLERLRLLEELRNAEGRISAQPPGQTAQDLPLGRADAEAAEAEAQQAGRGPVSGLVNTITEFASTSPPGGPRESFLPEVTVLPKWLETAVTSAVLTAAPTATASKIAKEIVQQSPRAARFLPVVTETVANFLTRRQNVAQGFEEPGTTGDILATGLPAAGRAVGAATRAIGRGFAPQLQQSSAAALQAPTTSGITTRELIERGPELLEEGGDVVTAFTRGETIRATMREAEDQLGTLADEAFGGVRKQIQDNIGEGGLLDITEVDKLARSLGLPLNRLGVTVERSGSGQLLASIDDAMRISSRTGGSAAAAFPQDRIKAAALRKIRTAMDKVIQREAKDAGAEEALTQARRFFAQDIAPRFRTRTARRLLDEVQTSGEQIITKAPTLSVQDAIRMERMIVKVADEFTDEGRAIFSQADALHELHTGAAARLLKNATNDATGQLQPNALLRTLDQMQPEVRRILLGAPGAKALREFALKLGQAQRRVTMGLGAAGMAALSGAGGRAVGPVGAVGALEAANELNMLGRMVVGNPVVFRKLLRRVLNGEADAITDFTALTGIRIGAGQVLRGIGEPQPPQPPPFPETADQPLAR